MKMNDAYGDLISSLAIKNEKRIALLVMDGVGDCDNEGKGTKTVAYSTRLPTAGTYEIRLWATASGNRATNVPVTVQRPSGSQRIMVNQRKGPAETGFVSLGMFACPANETITVSVSTAGTDGFVVADAVQFIPVE